MRSFVYHQAQASMRPQPGADDEAEKLKTDIQELEAAFETTKLPALEGMLAEKRRELARLASSSTDGIAWPELVNRLVGRIEVYEWIKGVWEARDEELFTNGSKLAEFLLLREFARRPKRANSAETLGIARLRNPSIDRLGDAQLPSAFRRRGKTLDDWRTYLDAVLTWFVRASLSNWFMLVMAEIHSWSAAPWNQSTISCSAGVAWLLLRKALCCSLTCSAGSRLNCAKISWATAKLGSMRTIFLRTTQALACST